MASSISKMFAFFRSGAPTETETIETKKRQREYDYGEDLDAELDEGYDDVYETIEIRDPEHIGLFEIMDNKKKGIVYLRYEREHDFYELYWKQQCGFLCKLFVYDQFIGVKKCELEKKVIKNIIENYLSNKLSIHDIHKIIEYIDRPNEKFCAVKYYK